jgi:acyl-[acyl-carrier-protein]-phospholipid O-acyltransferase/long-chain-fatty-acid--[acyl-carrier-protein] ligase
MSTGPIQFLGLERLPGEGTVIVPSRLGYGEMRALEEQLSGRPLTWLAEEHSLVEPEVRDYLAKDNVVTATISQHDPAPEGVGEALLAKLQGGGVLIFVPGDIAARPGASCHIPSSQLRFLCQLGLPILPIAIHRPAEVCLSIENKGRLPAAIISLGHPIPADLVTVARFHESLLEGSERAFASREFLNGSLPEALLAGLKKWGSSTTLLDGTDDSAISYHKLMAAAIAFSKEIRKATRQPRVGIILPPGRGGLLANLAVLFANKIPVNLNFTASHAAVESAIEQAELDKFITADPFVRKVGDFPWPPNRDLIFIERVLPTIRKKIVKWAILGKLLPTRTIAKLLGLGKRRGNDEAILLFTSGSSGEPKGVPLSHRNILANVCQFTSPLELPRGSRILGCLPLFHSFGCTVTLWYPVIEGIDLVTYPSPLEVKRLAELIDQHEVYLLLSTPTFLRGYMRRVKPEQLSSLRLVVTGAEKLPTSLAQAFEKKFGIRTLEGYGLTETSPGTNVNLLAAEPPSPETPVLVQSCVGSVGPLLPGQAIRLTNPATDEATTLDQSGIIWLKGGNIFLGYLNRPDLTEGVIVDGWFKTGDVGHLDDDGCLHIEGRMSRFSKIAGEMVPHETLEASIIKALGLDGESERKIAVVGIPDEKKGEAIALLSSIASDTIQQEAVDLRYKLMDTGIPSLWCPREIIPVDEIPVLASGKLDIKGCQKLAMDGR